MTTALGSRVQTSTAVSVPRSRLLAAVALFSALAVVLNIAVRIPAPYAPFLIYEIWEIPILTALLLYGFRAGGAVAIVNTASLLVIFRGQLPTGPLYNLVAVLSMLTGVAVAIRLANRSFRQLGWWRGIVLSTAIAILLRVVVMTIMNASLLPFPPPVGFSIPIARIPGLLVLIAIFNVTVTLYTVPLAYGAFRAVVARSGLRPVVGVPFRGQLAE